MVLNLPVLLNLILLFFEIGTPRFIVFSLIFSKSAFGKIHPTAFCCVLEEIHRILEDRN